MKSSVLPRLRAYDKKASENAGLVAGVDEAGCGPLAGPVVAAAVILFRYRFLSRLNDSKKLSQSERKRLFRFVAQNALVGIGIATEKEIDTHNIFQANCLAMRRAVLSLTRTPELLLIDGNRRVDLPLPQKKIIRGDAKSASIAAASIIAKVYRDAWMEHLDRLYPGYQLARHKGYPTAAHLKLLKEKGPLPVHRRSFSPVKLAEAGACFETA